MADFIESQGVKTHRDNETRIQIVDGQSGTAATNILSVVKDGDAYSAGVNDFGIPVYMKDEDGNYCLPALDGNCNQKVVIVSDDDDVDQHKYMEHTDIANDATSDMDQVITNAKKVKKVKLTLSSPGLFKYEIGEYDGVSVFTVRAVVWTEPANNNFHGEICIPEITGDGSKALRVRVTNKDNQDNTAYTTACFVEYV